MIDSFYHQCSCLNIGSGGQIIVYSVDILCSDNSSRTYFYGNRHRTSTNAHPAHPPQHSPKPTNQLDPQQSTTNNQLQSSQ